MNREDSGLLCQSVGILARLSDSDKEDMNIHGFGYIRYGDIGRWNSFAMSVHF